MKLSLIVTRHYRTLFFLLLTALLVTGSLTQKDKALVVTTESQYGMISMELNCSNADRDKMLEAWDCTYKNILVYDDTKATKVTITGRDALIAENNHDYLFIPCYVLLLLLFIVRLGEPVMVPKGGGWVEKTPFSRRWVMAFAALTVIAGLMDVLEDIGINRILHASAASMPDVNWVFIPSIFKWILLLIIFIVLAIEAFRLKRVALWLEELSGYFKTILGWGWEYRIVLITLSIFFLVLYISDQGQDLLLTVNGSGRLGCFLFLLTITVISLLCWHVPKAMENAKGLHYAEFWLGPVDFSTTNPGKPDLKVDIARLLGAAGFLVPATGILKTMQTYHIIYPLSGIPASAVLAVLMILYTLALSHGWIQQLYQNGKRIKLYIGTMIVLAVFIIIPLFRCGPYDPSDLIILFIDLLIMSVMFLITVTLRTSIWPSKKPGVKHGSFFDRLRIAPFITFGAAACALIFIACNFPSFLHNLIKDNRFFTIPIVFCAVAGYMLFFSYLLFLGKKTGIHFSTILLLFTTLSAIKTVTDYHDIAVVTNPCPKQLDSLDVYAKNWLLKREGEMQAFSHNHNNQPYPVYFVNAHGGGIRAAIWTTMVVGTLDSTLRSYAGKTHDSLGFQHYVFSYSGASGGTVGNALLCGARYTYANAPWGDNIFYPKRQALYKTDNLTSDIVALLGRDMIMYSFGVKRQYFHIVDRGRLMEQDWEYNANHQKIDLSTQMSQIWCDDKMEVPLLFANTYDIHDGKKGIVAPVLLDSTDFPATILLEQKPELLPTADLRLSTAAFLSARFPYVSPTGKFGLHHFTDGGTIENSGGETSQQVINVFERVRKKLIDNGHTALKNMTINVLALPNEVAPIESPEQKANIYEPIGPPLGILETVNSNALKAEEINRNHYNKLPYSYVLFRPDLVAGNHVWPILPLGWQISDYALNAMATSAQEYPSKLDTVYAKFGIKRTK
ncbi:MAG: hypothetical protein ACXVI9_00445 [Mucilaginibacter sp.]